jgi:amino-acid N-acetyltransferase
MDVTSDEWLTFVSLWTLADLPVLDRTEGGRFFVVEDEMGLVRVGGIEGSGPDQLLRSVVVTPGVRRRGMGPSVVQRLVDQARRDGAERLWLLTTDANHFFAGLGWTEVPRDHASEAVRASRLYGEICPATAALMMRPLS